MKNFFTTKNNEIILKMAAVYSLVWGLIIAFIPKVVLTFFGVETPYLIEFWQLTGMIVGVIGVGYFIAAQDAGKYWPIILIGFLGNLMGTFVFGKAIINSSLPVLFASILFLSAFIWLWPFYNILQSAYAEILEEDSPAKQFSDLVRFVRTSKGKTLLELSNEQNVLLVFVRHFGCTFCRETVSEIAKIESAIIGRKLTVVFVHMSDPAYGDVFFSKYYDHPVHHISDPSRALYKSLNLRRGTINQLLGPMAWVRGIYAGIFKGHGLGEFEGDSMQLGGIFILSKGQIIFEKKAKTSYDTFEISTLPEL